MLWVLFKKKSDNKLISLVPTEEYTIGDMAELIAKEFQLKGVVFDTSKADGQYKKTMGNDTLVKLLKNFKFTTLEDGLQETIQDFIRNNQRYRL